MPVKPGYMTTEFWVTVLVQIVSILSISGVFTTEQATQWQKVAEVGGGLIAMIISNVAYAMSRAKTKSGNETTSKAGSVTQTCNPMSEQGETRVRAMAAITLCFVAVFALISCGPQNLKPISEMTPKEKATFFMSVYNKQADDYRATVAKPDLTEAQKTILRDKKEVMTEVYPMIELYVGYVDAGALPDQATERLIIGYLDRLVAMSTK